MTLLCFLSFTVLSSIPNNSVSLPDGGALTLEFVTSRALESSDKFQEIRAGVIESRVPELQAHGYYDPLLSARFLYQNNQNEPAVSYQPVGEKGWKGSVGIASNIPSGTSLSARLSHEKNQLELLGSPTSRYHYGRVDFEARQSLIRDFLGLRGRNLAKAGSLSTNALKYQLVFLSEELWLTYADYFYSSWLLQRETEAAKGRLNRRRSLESVSDKRFKRGTSESADHLQVQAARIGAETDFETRSLQLGDIWRALILSLHLPSEFLQMDPLLVPMKLDDPSERSLELCQAITEADLEKLSSGSRVAKLQSAASQAAAQSAKLTALPELSAVGALSAGNQDPEMSGALKDSAQFKNKGWSLGLEFEMPLFLRKERAESLARKAAADRDLARASQQRTSDWVQFRNLCEEVKTKKQLLVSQRAILKKQEDREQSLERRYRIGDSNVFDVVQAGDDRSLAETSLFRMEVDLRLASWKVIRLAGGLKEQVAFALGLEKFE